MTSAITRHLVRLSQSVPLPTLKQGSTLSICSKNVPHNVAVRIQSGWRDDGHATLVQYMINNNHTRSIDGMTSSKSNLPAIVRMVVEQQHDKVTSLGRSESHLSISLQPSDEELVALLLNNHTTTTGSMEYQDGDAVVTADFLDEITPKTTVASSSQSQVMAELTLQVPEKINLQCELFDQGGSIYVEQKIEGDVKLLTTNGSIWAKKLRGHTIELETKSIDNVIYSSDLLEAQNLKVTLPAPSRFRAKRIHGDTVDIKVLSQQQSAGTTVGSTSTGSKQHHVTSTSSSLLDEDDEGSLVDISSMYVSGMGGAHVSVEGDGTVRPLKRAVRIKSHHGPVLVDVSGVHQPATIVDEARPNNNLSQNPVSCPLVELGSVNGSCEVAIRDIPSPTTTTTTTTGKNKANTSDSWVACQVHYDSISPESVSLIHTESGDIGLTFDRKLEADLRLFSTLDQSSLAETAAMLAEEDDLQQLKGTLVQNQETKPELVDETHLVVDPEQVHGSAASEQEKSSRISIQTQSFTESESYCSPDNSMQYTEGWVENKSHEPDSRFEMKTRGAEGSSQSVGKIRLEGAANQALKNFSAPLQSTFSATSSSTNDGDSTVDTTTPRPLIVAATTGNITVETLSWLGAIARRYGLDEKGRDLGRQATRRGRVVLPADDES